MKLSFLFICSALGITSALAIIRETSYTTQYGETRVVISVRLDDQEDTSGNQEAASTIEEEVQAQSTLLNTQEQLNLTEQLDSSEIMQKPKIEEEIHLTLKQIEKTARQVRDEVIIPLYKETESEIKEALEECAVKIENAVEKIEPKVQKEVQNTIDAIAPVAKKLENSTNKRLKKWGLKKK